MERNMHERNSRQNSAPNSVSNSASNNDSLNKKSKTKSVLRKFFLILAVSFGAFLICATGLMFAYYKIRGTEQYDPEVAAKIGSNIKRKEKDDSTLPAIPDIFEKPRTIFEEPEEHLNFAIMGLDGSGDDTRTDSMMVGTFNTKTRELSIVSIPRDAKVTMPESRRKVLEDKGLWTPSDGIMKMNEVYHYATSLYGPEFVAKQLEEMMNIEINYYATINLDAFKFIVDEIGGVDFDVPQNMYYTDPEQDLYINLTKGPQLLDGEHAMQLVRFRRYNEGDDWKRMEVQQDFMRAVINQILISNTLEKISTITKTVYSYVHTNLDLTDAIKFSQYIGDLNQENLFTYTLPGTGGHMIGGKDYVILDSDGVNEIVDEIFNSVYTEVDSKDKKIQILNGGSKEGIAKKSKEYVESMGFTVESTGDYNAERTDGTRIFVRKKGMGKDIQRLFNGSELIVSSSKTKDYDIVIVLGNDVD